MADALRRARSAGVVLALLLASAGCSAPVDAPTAEPVSEPATFEVLGFAEAGDGTAAITRTSALTAVGVDGVTLEDGGRSLPLPGGDAVAALAASHDRGLDAVLLFSNFDGALGDFSPETAATLLADPDARAAVVGSLATAVDEQGWDGVMIDLESITEDDADDLTALAVELRAALGDGIRLDIAIMAATDAAGYRAWGYDLPALAEVIDRFTIMTYDQHGPWSEAGPIGALDWQRSVLAALLDEVPAAQIDLGLAGYGYRWGPDDASAVSVADARDLAGADARFDAAVGEWTAQLEDGTVLWWSDSRSQRLRYGLADELGLGGVAIWSLGQSDTIPAPG